jgi:hypothetical protein
MKFSPSGDRIASANYDPPLMDILDFDKSSGNFSNPITFSPPPSFSPYGLEFSPSGNALYLSDSYIPDGNIYQLNLNAGSPAAITASAILIHSFPHQGGALQTAPDGKIYFTIKNTKWLGVINNPDVIGSSCNPSDNGLYLGTAASCDIGLPNFISNIFSPLIAPTICLATSDTSFCEKRCINFYDLSANSPTSWQWLFPGSGSPTSTLQNPTNICYTQYGSFDVTLIACNAVGCDTLVLPGFINEYPTPTPTITQSNDTLFSSPGVAYQWWSTDSGIIAGANNYFYIPTQAGNYFVVVSDTIGCQGASNTIITAIAPLSFGEGLGVRCSPNPNNGSFTITLPTTVTKDFSIHIINPLGQEIYNKQTAINNGQQTIDVQIENAAKGLYLVEVINGGRIFRGKFIVK